MILSSPRGWYPEGEGWQYAEMATSTTCPMTGEGAPKSVKSENVVWISAPLLEVVRPRASHFTFLQLYFFTHQTKLMLITVS